MTQMLQSKIRKDPWWHIVGLLSGFIFAVMLAYARLMPQALDHIDSIVTPHLVEYQTLHTVEIFLSITILGSALGVVLVAFVAAFFLRRSLKSILRLFFLLIGAALSMDLAKLFVERARPDSLTWIDPISSFSFPSGHTTLATALYGFIAVSLYRRAQSRSGKIASITIPSVVILAVGYSRLALNFHYFTDVVGGVLLGLFWLSIIFMTHHSMK